MRCSVKWRAETPLLPPYYAGDYLTMAENNPDLKFVYPKEGTNIFVDSMCIPASSKNVEAAQMFINFMLDPEVALANAGISLLRNTEYLGQKQS